MRTATLTLLAALLLGCFDSDDGRRQLDGVECDADGCRGLWEQSDDWSPVYDADELPDGVDPGSLWPCAPDPDVDACGVADSHGRIACWRAYGKWGVVVAPACAVEGPQWIDVGAGMVAASV